MDTAFVAGRDFDQRENLGSPKVSIVNEMFARQTLSADENPVERAFRRYRVEAGMPDPMFTKLSA